MRATQFFGLFATLLHTHEDHFTAFVPLLVTDDVRLQIELAIRLLLRHSDPARRKLLINHRRRRLTQVRRLAVNVIIIIRVVVVIVVAIIVHIVVRGR